MAAVPSAPNDLGHEADRAALPATGHVLLYLAGVLAIVAFIIGYISNLGTLVSFLVAAIIALALILVFLWNGREYLVGAARTAREGEETARRDATASRSEADRLRPFESRFADQTKELDGLRTENKALTSSLNQAQAEKEQFRVRAERAEANATQLGQDVQRLGAEILAERNSTARAPFLPELRPSVEVKGFGILGPKTVQVKTENIGRGNALNIRVSALLVTTGRPDRQVEVDFIPALTPREFHYSVVGDLNQLAGVEVVEGQLQYESQFGPCRPMASRTAL